MAHTTPSNPPDQSAGNGSGFDASAFDSAKFDSASLASIALALPNEKASPADAAAAPRYSVMGPAGAPIRAPWGSFAGKQPSDAAAQADPTTESDPPGPTAADEGPTGSSRTPDPPAGANGPAGPNAIVETSSELAARVVSQSKRIVLGQPTVFRSAGTAASTAASDESARPPQTAEKSRRKAVRAKSARTKVGGVILKNSAEIGLIGASFIELIDERLASLRLERPNSPEAIARSGDGGLLLRSSRSRALTRHPSL